jgi:hypothetical protein
VRRDQAPVEAASKREKSQSSEQRDGLNPPADVTAPLNQIETLGLVNADDLLQILDLVLAVGVEEHDIVVVMQEHLAHARTESFFVPEIDRVPKVEDSLSLQDLVRRVGRSIVDKQQVGSRNAAFQPVDHRRQIVGLVVDGDGHETANWLRCACHAFIVPSEQMPH